MTAEPSNIRTSKVDIVDRKMALAKRYGPRTQEIAERIASQFGGYTTPLNYKSRKSILRKLKNDGGDISDIKDLARTTIIVPGDQINNVLNALEREKNTSRIKRQTPDQMEGYSGNIVNLKFRGVTTEIQVNTEKMIFAKERISDAVRILGAKRWREIRKETGMPGGWGHAYYEDFRDKTLKSRRGYTNRQKAKTKDYISKIDSRIYYSFFQD